MQVNPWLGHDGDRELATVFHIDSIPVSLSGISDPMASAKHLAVRSALVNPIYATVPVTAMQDPATPMDRRETCEVLEQHKTVLPAPPRTRTPAGAAHCGPSTVKTIQTSGRVRIQR